MNKPVAAAVFITMFLSTISILRADYDPNIICDDSGAQKLPAVDGTFVIWEDGVDIYWLDLSDPDRVRHKLTGSGTQDNAALGGGRIVWRDRVDSDDDIYGYDISANSYFEMNPGTTSTGPDQRNPKVSAEYVVCEDRSGSAYNTAVFKNGAFEPIDPMGTMQTDLDIDGSVVVWRDTRNGNQIYRCDLDVTPYAVEAVYPDGGVNQWRPDISGSVIVFEDTTNASDTVLIAYDTQLGAVIWSNTQPGQKLNAAISGGLIVWQEDAGGNYDIRGYDLDADVWLEIATGGENDELPDVSGRMVVWQRNGVDIIGAYIPPFETNVLTVTSPAGGEQVLAGKGELLIAWDMLKGGLPDEVKIEFSSDARESWDIVEEHVPADAAYLWAPVANVHSQQCQIRVSIFGDESVDAVSEEFTIFQCDADLTADVTGDCFVDLADVAALAAQWLLCGHPTDPSWCESH